MNYPFPGMNPYMEHASLWTGIHVALINAISISLAPQIEPRYYVAPEERTYIIPTPLSGPTFIGRPDVAVVQTSPEMVTAAEPIPSQIAEGMNGYPYVVQVPVGEEIRERYLEIRSTHEHKVVTVIEVLSPANKRAGQGRVEYETKRQEILSSQTNLVEIDLLRSAKPLDVFPKHDSYHYRLLVSRAWQRPNAVLYPFNVKDVIPEIPVPLQKEDLEPSIALGKIVPEIYNQFRYNLRIDYGTGPRPRLDKENTLWLAQILQDSGLR